jgi:hypothetical protein
VSRVYKGAVGERQEIVAPPGGPSGPNCSGVGLRHLARSHSWCSHTTRRVTGTGSNLAVRLQHVQWVTAAVRRWRTGPWWVAAGW